jgi:hypothetical protein
MKMSENLKSQLIGGHHELIAESEVRTTLTDPQFVNFLKLNNFVVWGGDIRDKDAWSSTGHLCPSIRRLILYYSCSEIASDDISFYSFCCTTTQACAIDRIFYGGISGYDRIVAPCGSFGDNFRKAVVTSK